MPTDRLELIIADWQLTNRVWQIFFFWPNTNTEYFSVFRNHRIPNIEYYSVWRKLEYQISNTIWYQENPNTEYKYYYSIQLFEYQILQHIQHFGKNETKIKTFVPYKTFCYEILWNYSDRYSVQLFKYPNILICHN